MAIKQMLIGRSLSICVGQILRGDVDFSQVLGIVSMTMHPDLTNIAYEPHHIYFKDKFAAQKLMTTLAAKGMILQPRTWDIDHVHYARRDDPQIEGLDPVWEVVEVEVN